jgi:toxin ParE1/3/4
VAQDSIVAADRLIDHITARCRDLGEFPQLGPARPEVAPDARMLVIGEHLALYRIVDDGVEILRVVHGARRLDGLFD